MVEQAGVAKYRKRPVEVEAVQWQGTAATATPIIDWVLRGGGTARYHEPESLGDGVGDWNANHRLAITTLEGTMWASPSDWIIRGVKGEFYPRKPDIFDATYEPVES